MKRFKIWNSRPLLKRHFLFNQPIYFPTIILGMLLGTYLDLFFTGMGVYSFPSRPFSNIVSIHLVFTLAVLPVYLWIFLCAAGNMSRTGRLLFILLLSLASPVMEALLEDRGLFHHSSQWKHMYSFVGYLLFLICMWKFFKWSNQRLDKGRK